MFEIANYVEIIFKKKQVTFYHEWIWFMIAARMFKLIAKILKTFSRQSKFHGELSESIG